MNKERLPEFIGLGTQKGGTTTLHELLSQHPEIYLPACKEVHYFDLNHDRQKQWYAQHFRLAKTNELCGEITPYYLYHKEVPRRMHKLLPNAKLIVLLRDPIERTLSHIFHAQKRGFELLNVRDAISAEEKRLETKDPKYMQRYSYVARSKYYLQLRRYEEVYEKRKILIIKSESLFEDTEITWQKILEFLGLKEQPIQKSIPIANKGPDRSQGVDQNIRIELRERLEKTYKDLEKWYGISWQH